MASCCLKFLSSRLLAAKRQGNIPSGVVRSLSIAATAHPILPTVQREYPSEIPSATTLSGLNLFGLWRASKKDHEINIESSSQVARRDEEARQQQRLGVLRKHGDGGTETQLPMSNGGLAVASSQTGFEQQEGENIEGGGVGEDGGTYSDTAESDGASGGSDVGGGDGGAGAAGAVGRDGGGGARLVFYGECIRAST